MILSTVSLSNFRCFGPVTQVVSLDDGYLVDQWYLDDVIAQVGGSSYTLSTVAASHALLVTFKLKTYTLALLKVNGDVTIEPALTEFPHGGEIVLTAHPDSNYRLYDWRGDVSGVGNVFRFRITRNMTIQAYFQQLAQSITMQVANSTPATTIQILIPAAPEMLHIVQWSDNLIGWCNVRVLDGALPNSLSIAPPVTGVGNEFYRCSDVQKITTPPFLIFPVTNRTTGHNWTSLNTPVSSIFDHHGSAYNRDGVISTYRGEMVTISDHNGFRFVKDIGNIQVSRNPGTEDYFKNFLVVGYRRDPSKVIPLLFDYKDNDDILWYDGHSGYDYAVGTSEDVVAVADGDVLPEESDDCYKVICIDHGNGYRSYYYHLSARASRIEVGGVVQRVPVVAGEIIGHPGDTTCGAPIGVHLHFELRRNVDNTWTAVDPYGSKCINGDEIEHSLWIDTH